MMNRVLFSVSLIYQTLIFSTLFYTVFTNENLDNVHDRPSKNGAIPRKWIKQLFYEAEKNFDMDPSVNKQCFNDYNYYKEHLTVQSGWAIRMLESSEWPTTGSILSGTTTHLGNWDECLRVSLPYMKGQYCLIEGFYNFDKITEDKPLDKIVEWPSDELSAWEILRMFEQNPMRVNRKNIQWALCIPSTCDSKDLETSLRNVIYPLFESEDLHFHLNVSASSCHVKDKTEYSPEYSYASIFFLAVISLVCISTAYDIQHSDEEKINEDWKSIATSFSLIRNCNQLFSYSKKVDYGSVYALKWISLIIIIYGHRRIYSLGYPSFNPEQAEINFKKNINYVELTHFVLVDIFFMLTGFLTFFLNFSSMSRNGIRYWYVAIIHRWLRLIPTFGVLLVFFIYIFPYISDGPLWDAKVSQEINHCKASWWANMLAINNFVATENQCLIVSWYISADMQLAIIGFGLLYITSKNRTWGWIAIIITFIFGAVVTFIVAYINKFHAIMPIDFRFLQNPNSSEDFINFYGTFYSRLGPYLIGAMAALITQTLKAKNYKFSTKQKVFGLILAFIIGEGFLHIGYEIEFDFARPYNAMEHALFAATYRSVFVLSYALILCIYFTTGFSSLDTFYENRFFAAFGRLTYSVFLVNTIFQLLHAASQKTNLSSSILINRFWWVAGDSVFSYFCGMWLYLLAEAPIANLSKIVKQMMLRRKIEHEVRITADVSPSHQTKN